MAASRAYVPCTLFAIEDNLYFKDLGDEPDLQSDSFQRSTTFSVHWLRVKDNLLLSVASEQLQFEVLTKNEREGSECQFIVQLFNNTLDSPPHSEERGRAVILAARVMDQYKVLSCGDGNDIKVQTMRTLPEIIEDDDYGSVFYMKHCPLNIDRYLFRSAAQPNHALGFEPVQGNPSTLKVVLRECTDDEVDECCHIDVPHCL